jgi:hypothetical protein
MPHGTYIEAKRNRFKKQQGTLGNWGEEHEEE